MTENSIPLLKYRIADAEEMMLHLQDIDDGSDEYEGRILRLSMQIAQWEAERDNLIRASRATS